MSQETETLGCGYRAPDDDFFCEKYQVWYPVGDCNYRVVHSTFTGCVECFQGRINLRRLRPSPPSAQPGKANLIRFPQRSLPKEQPAETPERAPREG